MNNDEKIFGCSKEQIDAMWRNILINDSFFYFRIDAFKRFLDESKKLSKEQKKAFHEQADKALENIETVSNDDLSKFLDKELSKIEEIKKKYSEEEDFYTALVRGSNMIHRDCSDYALKTQITRFNDFIDTSTEFSEEQKNNFRKLSDSALKSLSKIEGNFSDNISDYVEYVRKEIKDIGRLMKYLKADDVKPIETMHITWELSDKTPVDVEELERTAWGILWVSRDKATVYDFYQKFINLSDEDVDRLLTFYSDIEMDDIRKMCAYNIGEAKKIMAFEITKLVHGEEKAIKVRDASEAVFNCDDKNIPSYHINREEFIGGLDLAELMVRINMAYSRSEVKHLLTKGGIYLNNSRVMQNPKMVTEEDIVENALVLKKGKKNYMKVVIED